MSIHENDGYVGIGTDEPDQKLHVSVPDGPCWILVETTDNNAPAAGIRVKNTLSNMYFGASSAYDAFTVVDMDNPTASLLEVRAGGNVGIGTTEPDEKLDVDGNIKIGSSDAFYLGDANTDGSWRFTRSGNNLVFQRRESSTWVTKSTISA